MAGERLMMAEETQTQHWSLEEMLADITRAYPGLHELPRAWAAQVLEAVGFYISYGESNSGYSAREIGWALVRVFSTFDKKALGELTKGYEEATAYYADATIPDDLKPKTSVE
jgi:hypothetical protein